MTLLASRLYTIPNDTNKIDTKGKKPEGETLTKLEGITATTENTAIKLETTGKERVKEKKTEPRKTPNHSTEKWLP